MTGTEAPTTVRPCWLPGDIWWLIIEKAAEEPKNFTTLLLLARLCRDMALIALPLMYGKYKDPDSPDNSSEEASVCFWRSIIMSSLGKTLYPYCLWIKTLNIPHLQGLLQWNQYLPPAPYLRQKFYSPPLDYLEILDNMKTEGNRNSEVVLFEVTNEIMKYIKSMADQGHGSASLVCLEGPDLGWYTSSVYFPAWASGLTSLTTLRVIDGGFVSGHIAQSLMQHCPRFKHLIEAQRLAVQLAQDLWLQTTDHSSGFYANVFTNESGCDKLPAGAESNIARFCEQLSPNTLESFYIREPVDEGQALFQALHKHAQSLRQLRLFSLTSRAFASLDRLQNCTGLEALVLEGYGSGHRDANWASNHASVYSRIVAWLQDCSQLEQLELSFIANASQLLQDVLKSPNVRLTSLRFDTSEANAPWYTSLHHQQSLRYLEIQAADGTASEIAKAISQLPELRGLSVDKTFSLEDLEEITEGALNLETITLNRDGYPVYDAYLIPLAKLPRLKRLHINKYTEGFTCAGLLEFVKKMEKDPNGQHDGFTFTIEELDELWLAEDDENELKDHIKRAFNGTFYTWDPWYTTSKRTRRGSNRLPSDQRSLSEDDSSPDE